MGADRLPIDLPGGWESKTRYTPEPLKAGQVWRMAGPVGAIKILRVMMPGHPEHDGGAQGISVSTTVIDRGGRVRWSKQSAFLMGTEKQTHSFLQLHGYGLADHGSNSAVGVIARQFEEVAQEG